MAIKNYLSSTGSWAKHAAIIAVLGAMGALLGSCGGGGVASTTTSSGPLQVLPGSANIFPDVPTELTVSGGTPPYSTFTSDGAVIPTPPVSGSKVTVTARNVNVDTSVTITVKDSAGATSNAVLGVKAATLNNTVTFTPVAPTGTGCGSGLCSGGDAQVVVTAVYNGTKLTNRPIRFDVFQGDFRFVTPGTNVQVTSLILNTDENGQVVARLQSIVTAPTQVATLTSTDTVTGLVRYTSFVIVQQTSGTGILSSLPSGTTTFTGAKPAVGQPAQCPFGGVVDYYIYGGTPPYQVVSPLPQLLSVFPSIVTTNGGSFRATINGCGTSQLIVTDAQNRVIETSQVTGVTGPAGDAPPTPTPATLTVTPTSHTLTCTAPVPPATVGTGQTGTSTTAGTGTFTATVTTPGVPPGSFTVSPSSGTVGTPISFTRNPGIAGTSPTSITVNIVAGTITVPVTVNVPALCP
ncbi:MAG: hypothetical protein ABL931_00710 [Usitatibacteraceae bacterium]